MHGPHQLRGIEVYKNRPIFYSLADFIFHEELYDPLPADMYELFGLPGAALQTELEEVGFKGGTIGFPSNPVWYESVVAVPTFRGSETASEYGDPAKSPAPHVNPDVERPPVSVRSR